MKDKASVELTFRLPVDLCCKSDDSCGKPNDEPPTGGGSGIEEAPKDGKSYARQNGKWVAIENGGLGSIDIPSVVSNSYVGEIFYYAKTTPPPNALFCDGGAVSREEYAELFAVIGTSFGEGDGETTFNVPDMRGEFVRGYDPENVRDPEGGAREFGKHQEATAIPYVYLNTGGADNNIYGMKFAENHQNVDKVVGESSTSRVRCTGSNIVTSVTYPGRFYARPTNINLLPCIRAK
jgi:microcystin-dependent protein